MRACVPEVSWDVWESLTAMPTVHVRAEGPREDVAIGHRGVIGLQDCEGYLFGLFLYSTNYSLADGRVLAAESLIAQDIIGRASVARRLVEAIEGTAIDLGCSTVRIVLPIADLALGHLGYEITANGGGNGCGGPFRLNGSGRLLDAVRNAGYTPKHMNLTKTLGTVGPRR